MGRTHPGRSGSSSQPVTAQELKEAEEIDIKVSRTSPSPKKKKISKDLEEIGINVSAKSPSPKKKNISAKDFEEEDDEIEMQVTTTSPSPKKNVSQPGTPSKNTSNISKRRTSSGSKGKHEGEDDTTENDLTQEDLEKGMNLLVAMSQEDFQIYLDRMETECPRGDKYKVKIRNGHLNWDKIAFGMYEPKQCRLIWEFLLSNARRYRIMHEVVQEFRYAVEKNPDYTSTLSNIPQQPPEAKGGFQVYVRDIWKLHQQECNTKRVKHMNWCQFYKGSQEKYQELSERDRIHYEKISKKANDKYQELLQAYLKEHPHLNKTSDGEKIPRVKKRKPTTIAEFPDAPLPPSPPYSYFIQSKLQKLDPPPPVEEIPNLKAKFSAKYQKLSDKKKAKWIDYTINYCQNYATEVELFQIENPDYVPRVLKIKSVLKKADIAIWEKYRGKPPRPRNSVFAHFFDEFCKNEENANIPEIERRRIAEVKFKELEWYDRQMHKMNFTMKSMDYRKKIAEYFLSIPDVVKPLALETVPRKYRSALVNVGKFPASEIEMTEGEDENIDKEADDENIDKAADDENADKDNDADFTEEEAPRKKKKNKKRKYEDESGVEDIVSPSETNNLREESEDIASDASSSRRKRKKRKGGDSQSALSQEAVNEHEEVITGDVNLDDDDQNIKIEEPFSVEVTEQRTSPRRILPKLKAMSPPKTILSNANVVPKPPTSNFVPHKVGQQDIDDAVRGIFDGRAHIGRRFSVYYFYAKYVSQDKKWVQHADLFGVLETADKIVASFLELTDKQKDIFIAQSYNFFLQRRYGIVMKGTKKIYEPDDSKDFYPGEPRPPTRSAARLYQKEVEYLTRKDVSVDFPKWEDLHVDNQMIFVKKLYRETQLYMKRYEEFVMNMTPNDMVNYVLFRAKNWENKYLKDHTAAAAVKGFIFPLPRNEMIDGYESGPEMVEDDLPGEAAGCRIYERRKLQQVRNPFAVTRPKLKDMAKIKNNVQIRGEDDDADESSCVSSDDEVMTPAVNFSRDQPNRRHFNETKEFFFPMGVLTKKMLSPTKVRKRFSKAERERMRKAQLALAASRKIKVPKGKESKILFKNRIKRLGDAITQKRKAKVRLPKQRNFNEEEPNAIVEPAQKKKVKVLLPESRNAGSETEMDEPVTDIADAPDCSDFVRDLQSKSPAKKQPATAHAIPEYCDATEFQEEVLWEDQSGNSNDQDGELIIDEDGQLIIDEDAVLEPFIAYASDIQHETDDATLQELAAVPIFDLSDLNP